MDASEVVILLLLLLLGVCGVPSHLGECVDKLREPTALKDNVVFIITLGDVSTYYKRVHPPPNKERGVP
jgi:hypothetical protein